MAVREPSVSLVQSPTTDSAAAIAFGYPRER
jgi:hypothetical protein